MVKVAISFSGQTRFPTNWPTTKWREYIKEYNADVFVHTWIDDIPNTSAVLDRIVCCFNPKVIKFEPPRVFDTRNYYDRIWPAVYPYNVFSSFTSLYESMELVNKYSAANNFTYDYVIRARFDVVVQNLKLEPVDGVAVPDNPSKKVLKFTYREQDLWGIDDLVAYGSQPTMTKYANTIKNLDKLYLEEQVDMCPEIILTANLVSQDIPIVFRPMGTKIIRKNGDCR